MPSNSNNNANYGTVKSEKGKHPVYPARTSTDSTASTDALLRKETRTTSDEKKKLAEKAFLSGELHDLLHEVQVTDTMKLHTETHFRCRVRALPHRDHEHLELAQHEFP